ncbi:hypothetical protein [Deinococcus daejeonensis]|uniref:Uncharacterized protein n=1 Tax=Deinococcus daejeonensis TaxID=1007098 RepID=A0ABQ2J240_9DEIO|nr:hypothetical protein [Deinococcus daejeonensis]GGN37279.1 hypothetical protein GCM10010842_19000 [Deinococcus daejeonensis]
MRPDLLRPLLGTLGLLIGFTLYALAGKLAEPWQSVAIGGMFALLGLGAWVNARGERWIQGLGLLLLIYGLLRATVLR